MVSLRLVPLLQPAQDIAYPLVEHLSLLRQSWQRGQRLPVDGQSSLELALLHVECAQLQVRRASGLVMGPAISDRGSVQIGARLEDLDGLLALAQRYE